MCDGMPDSADYLPSRARADALRTPPSLRTLANWVLARSLARVMNWQVAEAALIHGGGSSGYCEDEMEKEKAAYAEHLRRRKKEVEAKGEHTDASAAMVDEHRKMREKERQAQLARIEVERQENEQSTSLVGRQFDLPPELSKARRPNPACHP